MLFNDLEFIHPYMYFFKLQRYKKYSQCTIHNAQFAPPDNSLGARFRRALSEMHYID